MPDQRAAAQIDVSPLKGWVSSLIATYYPAARPVYTFGFKRLQDAWETATLARTRVAIVRGNDPLPLPPSHLIPLPGIDLTALASMDGVTYGDLYFIREREIERESLHFHELVHVVQWKLLGLEGFLAAYVKETARGGYDGNQLEKMAYYLENLFTTRKIGRNSEEYVRAMLEGRPLPSDGTY